MSALFDPRLRSIFLLGIASGLPWLMIGSVLSAWLADEGVSRTSIGLFGTVFAVYTVNFLWSPLLDRFSWRRYDRRKTWILAMQALMVACCVLMAQLSPSQHLYGMAMVALAVAVFSATQDIAIDAYRIDILSQDDPQLLPKAASLATAGWWTGYGGIGALPFLLVDATALVWSHMYLLLATILLLIMGLTLVAPAVNVAALNTASRDAHHGMLAMVIAPFREFFSRNGVSLALILLSFIFLFKIGEAFLGRMSIVFYKEIGFSNSDIGTYSKLLNWWVTVAFSLLGGWITAAFGVYRGLFIAGIAMAASNLMFAVIASVGPDPRLLATAVVIDGFTSAWSTVAMVAFISLLCHQHFSATQYAMMASISTAGRTLLSSLSGGLVDLLEGNWTLFFILTTLMVIPSLCLLYYLRQHVRRLQTPAPTPQ